MQTQSLTKAFAARTHLGSIVVSQLTQKKAVHVDGGSDKNKCKQGRIQDFWKIDLSRGDPGFLEGGRDGIRSVEERVRLADFMSICLNIP